MKLSFDAQVPASRPPVRFGLGGRINCLFWAGFWLLIAYCLVNFGANLPNMIRLSVSGKQANAKVVSYTPTCKSRFIWGKTGPVTHWHAVEVEGRNVDLILGTRYPEGSKVSVIYLQGDPESAMLGKGGETFSQLVGQSVGWPGLLGGILLALWFCFLSVNQLIGVFMGRRLLGNPR